MSRAIPVVYVTDGGKETVFDSIHEARHLKIKVKDGYSYAGKRYFFHSNWTPDRCFAYMEEHNETY